MLPSLLRTRVSISDPQAQVAEAADHEFFSAISTTRPPTSRFDSRITWVGRLPEFHKSPGGGIDRHLVFLHEAANARHFGDATGFGQLVADVPVPNTAQISQRLVLPVSAYWNTQPTPVASARVAG